MLKISKNTIFYIICPANYATGGPEDLHQLALELRNKGFEVYMHYLNYDKKNNSSPVHKEYEKFEIPYIETVENNDKNILIFPETFSIFLWKKKYSKMQKIIWWLSVTNFLVSLKTREEYLINKKFLFIKKMYKKFPIPTIENIKKINTYHIAHSYFSKDFLKQNGINVIGQLIGYMEPMFLENKDYKSSKEDIVTYNAVKNGEFLEKIKALTPEIHWLPMQNMTLQEVADCMKKSKVYIDFGPHPGKEKMPREACLLDCCMIIGKEGSARYKEDMPILDEYHFEKDEKNIPEIIAKIHDCVENYTTKIKDFAEYKNFLLQEKETFENGVKNLFKVNQ